MMQNGQLDASAEIVNELQAFVASGGAMGSLDERKIRLAVGNMRDAYEHMQAIIDNPFADGRQPYYASSIAYYRAKYLRIKRCLVTYLLWRQQQITEAWWRARDSQLRKVLAPCEARYLQEYDAIMVEYMTSFAVPLDLRAFSWRPPCAHQLEVRGLKGHLFVSPVTGHTLSIYPGKQIALSFEEAEPLLLQGIVALIDK